MKRIYNLYIYLSLFTLISFLSCEKADSDKEWGIAKIYMPQANYNPYLVPNAGIDLQSDKNYIVDLDNNKVNIFLGVYRSGLQELQSYSVTVTPGTTALRPRPAVRPRRRDRRGAESRPELASHCVRTTTLPRSAGSV